MQGTFKNETSYEKRVELCKRINSQYSNRIPVIVEVAPKNEIKLDKTKYLVPGDIAVGRFLTEIRSKADVKPEEAIFIFCGDRSNILVPTSHTLDQLYANYRDDDGFMYLTIALENTFGTLDKITSFTFGVLDNILRTSGSVARGLGMEKII